MSERSRKDVILCDNSTSDDEFYVESSDSDVVIENCSSDNRSGVQRIVGKQFHRFHISYNTDMLK